MKVHYWSIRLVTFYTGLVYRYDERGKGRYLNPKILINTLYMKHTSKIVSAAALVTLLLPAITLANPINTNFKLSSVEANLKAKVGEKMEKRQEKRQEKTITGAVTSINGMTLMVKNTKDSVVYTVDATNAKLVRKFGATMVIGDIQVNDILFVNGTISTTTPTAITAKIIRDESLQARNATFNGTVTTITGTSFTLQSRERGLQTVNTTSSSTIKKNGSPATFADITVGATVRVDGVWNNTSNTVTAKTINILAKTRPISVSGTVTTKTDTSLTLTNEKGKVYTVTTAKLSLFNKDWTAITLGDVAVGDKVGVYGIQLNDSMTITGVWLRATVK